MTEPRKVVLVVSLACLLVLGGRLSLALTYSHALDAHAKGDYPRALPIIFGNALFDDAGACGLLGTMYLLGQGVEKSGPRAEYWLHKAASQGSTTSQSLLGMMYATGKGVARNDGKAKVWFLRAAASGDAQAVYALRKLHRGVTI